MLVALCGKSGSGKDTILDSLVKDFDFIKVLTYTTRPQRDVETGNEYHFVREDEFKRIFDGKGLTSFYKVKDGNIWWYGCSDEDLRESLESDKIYVVILPPKQILDLYEKLYRVNGEYHSFCRNFVPFYVYSDREVLYNRIKSRKDDHDYIERRMTADDRDFKDMSHLITNILINNDESDLVHNVNFVSHVAERMVWQNEEENSREKV